MASDPVAIPGYEDESLTETCPACDGTGERWSELYDDWLSCWRCHGNGEIEVP